MSLAHLIRDAKSGHMSLEMTFRYGEEPPEYMQGKRRVCGVNTVALFLETPAFSTGQSELRITKAGLTEYDGSTLKVYEPGYRDPTPEERAELEACQKQVDHAIEVDPYGSSGYWAKVAFFHKSTMPWLRGDKEHQGMKYIPWKDKVRDSHIRGDLVLAYNVYKEEPHAD